MTSQVWSAAKNEAIYAQAAAKDKDYPDDRCKSLLLNGITHFQNNYCL